MRLNNETVDEWDAEMIARNPAYLEERGYRGRFSSV